MASAVDITMYNMYSRDSVDVIKLGYWLDVPGIMGTLPKGQVIRLFFKTSQRGFIPRV
jgi:hypothetical protein